MTNSKMTYEAALNLALAADLPAEALEKLTALRDQIVKRNAAPHKPTKVQVENENLKALLADVLDDQPRTVSEIMSLSPTLMALSNQKVSALLSQMVDAGKAVKRMDKRKAYFLSAVGE